MCFTYSALLREKNYRFHRESMRNLIQDANFRLNL